MVASPWGQHEAPLSAAMHVRRCSLAVQLDVVAWITSTADLRDYLNRPLRTEAQQAIQCIRVLRAAGMIDATVVPSEVAGHDLAAVVLAITTKGRARLAQDAQGKPFR